MLTDPIADMLTRIRNAVAVRHTHVVIPASKMKLAIINKMIEEGYLAGVEVVTDGTKTNAVVALKYDRLGVSVIGGLERVSKPGRRMYAKAGALPRVRSGLGTLLVSTSEGVKTGAEARRDNFGGELICRIW